MLKPAHSLNTILGHHCVNCNCPLPLIGYPIFFYQPTICRFLSCNTNCSGLLYDFCDGEIYKRHPVFSSDKCALQIILYYDDVEVANPLGSYRGHHKLGRLESYRSGTLLFVFFFLKRSLLLFPWEHATQATFSSEMYSASGLCHYTKSTEVWF